MSLGFPSGPESKAVFTEEPHQLCSCTGAACLAFWHLPNYFQPLLLDLGPGITAFPSAPLWLHSQQNKPKITAPTDA